MLEKEHAQEGRHILSKPTKLDYKLKIKEDTMFRKSSVAIVALFYVLLPDTSAFAHEGQPDKALFHQLVVRSGPLP